MTREQRIVETFVEFADTMVEDFDAVEFLHWMAERCVELPHCTEVGVLLADTAGALRVMASSSERSEVLEVLQSQSEEGPCYESFHRVEQVFSENLAADEGAGRRSHRPPSRRAFARCMPSRCASASRRWER